MEKININSLDYYQNEPEGQFLDRKSARMRPKDILKLFVAFANAEGGQMESLFLNEPIYSEPNRNVLLILENNIMLRSMRVNNKLSRAFSDGLYETLSDDEKNVITNMYNTGRPTNTSKTAGLLSRSPNYSRKLLRRLAEQGILTWHGNSNTDSRQHYTLNINE